MMHVTKAIRTMKKRFLKSLFLAMSIVLCQLSMVKAHQPANGTNERPAADQRGLRHHLRPGRQPALLYRWHECLEQKPRADAERHGAGGPPIRHPIWDHRPQTGQHDHLLHCHRNRLGPGGDTLFGSGHVPKRWTGCRDLQKQPAAWPCGGESDVHQTCQR